MTAPDVPPGPVSLTGRQRQILDVIRSWVQRHGYPPTVREIGAAVGLGSPSSVAHHLKTLTHHGLIRRARGEPRAVDARPLADDKDPPVKSGAQHGSRVPLLGAIAAGTPILAEEHIEEVLSLPAELVGRGTLFALRVRGDSMTEAAINHGDVVAAMLDGEATVKQYRTRDGRIELVLRNPRHPVLPGDHATILGKVVCVLHRP